jgi:NAD(P)-dependent dehydrogenase (short-subunit alcohol dehydrogenase family)
MAKLLEGKNAVVTGAGRGIGKEIALALARHGANLVVNDLGADLNGTGEERSAADEVVAEIIKLGGSAVPNYDTVADFDAAQNIINICAEKFGSVDILVNVAGIVRLEMIYKMSEEDWDAVLAVHLKGTFNCCRHAGAIMRQQRAGRIVNITSDAWRNPAPSYASYSAAKGGIVSLTKAVAGDMVRYGVTCNAVAPWANTRMFDVIKGPWTPEVLEQVYKAGQIDKVSYDSMVNMPGPEHTSGIVVYLASDGAAGISGKVFGASRGRVALYSEPVEIKGLYKQGVWSPEELAELVPGIVG